MSYKAQIQVRTRARNKEVPSSSRSCHGETATGPSPSQDRLSCNILQERRARRKILRPRKQRWTSRVTGQGWWLRRLEHDKEKGHPGLCRGETETGRRETDENCLQSIQAQTEAQRSRVVTGRSPDLQSHSSCRQFPLFSQGLPCVPQVWHLYSGVMSPRNVFDPGYRLCRMIELG